MKKVAILGATGYIGKSLVNEFIESRGFELYLFVRSKAKARDFLKTLNAKKVKKTKINILDIETFGKHKYNIVINITGISDPRMLRENPFSVFETTEKFDNEIITYLKKNPTSLYINISSGALYGKNTSQPIDEHSQAIFDVNNLNSHPYAIAKINAEAKHRTLNNFNIVDLRVFAFFSRFLDLNGSFLMSEIAKCLYEKKIFMTSKNDLVRDYVNGKNIFEAIKAIAKRKKINDAFDVVSKKPVSKLEIISSLKKKFGLKYEFIDDASKKKSEGMKKNPTGNKNAYYSKSQKLHKLGYMPKETALEIIESELRALLRV